MPARNSQRNKGKNKRKQQKMNNRPLKRLNNNNNKNIQQKAKNMMKSQPNFLDALAEYKRIRNENQQEQMPSTSKENQENVKAYSKQYESITVISDDDLEDGEIIENPVTHYASLIAESFNEIEKSKVICDQKSPDLPKNVNQTLFYVDKSAGGGSSIVPLYTSLTNQPTEVIEIDDSIVENKSDDSVIFIDDGDVPVASSTLSEDAEADFISLSSTNSSLKSPERGVNRRERQRERLRLYKQRKMVEKVLELQSNGLLESMTIKVPKIVPKPLEQPSTSKVPLVPQTTVTVKPSPFVLPTSTATKAREKRIILIDGSNVAMSFTASNIGKKAMVNSDKEFSAEALNKVISYFEQKEFKVKAVVPEYRVRRDKSSNHKLMVEMLDSGKLITTPAKSYDDRILLESAAKLDAAIVSNDLFRDIRNTKDGFEYVVKNRQIRYNWVFGELILAEDPCGRSGPKLDDILFKNS